MVYRSEIDGLRALAVIPVIFFHAGFEIFKGGFVGVDVFFVISGFLITTLLIEDIENRKFSISSFLLRRARRILPALFFLVFTTLIVSCILMLPKDLIIFSKTLISVSVFASNIYFYRNIGYFDPSAEKNPLLHTWSLAVEEQFYIAFPIFLYLFWKFGKNKIFWVIIFISIISFSISEWTWRNDKASANFYLPISRAWELLLGSFAAFVIKKKGLNKSNIFSIFGLCLVIISIFIYDQDTPFPSFYTLAPVCGTLMIIIFADKGTFVQRFLSLKLLVFLGLISYSVYLYHLPLFVFFKMIIEWPSKTMMFSLSLVSIMLGYLSYKYIEQPFRKKNNIKDKKLILILFSFILFFIIFAGTTLMIGEKSIEKIWKLKNNEEYNRIYSIQAKEKKIILTNGRNSQFLTNCRFRVTDINDDIKEKILKCQALHGKGILIFGDSHAIDLFRMVTYRFDNPFIIGMSRGGCRPHTENNCYYKKLKTFLKLNEKVFSLAIYEQAGFYLLKDADGKAVSRKTFSKIKSSGIVNDLEINYLHLQKTKDYLDEISKIIPLKWFLPRAEPHISLKFVRDKLCKHNYSYRKGQFEIFKTLSQNIKKFLEKNLNNKIILVNQIEYLKFNFPQDFMNCKNIFWADSDHYSSSGVQYFSNRLPSNFLNY